MKLNSISSYHRYIHVKRELIEFDWCHYYFSHLQRINQTPLVEKIAKINQLGIADRLKELLNNHGFTLELLQSISSTADLAKSLCIDEYVAKIIIEAAKKKDCSIPY